MATFIFVLPSAHLRSIALKSLLTLVLHGALLYWTLQAMPGQSVLSQTVPVPIQALLIPPPRPAIPAPTTPPRPLPSAVSAIRPVARPKPHSAPKPAPVTLLTAASGITAMTTAPATPATPATPVVAEPVAMAAVAPAPTPPALEPARFNADYLNNPAPSYPLFSRRNREQGTVLLNVKVSAQGHAEQVQLKRSSGFSRLDEAALEAVRQWRFVPAQRGSVAVAANVVVPIVFRLDS
ncbi:MAG: energy transducer TonB [Glaciimonas sp.]|nr:energy transducer TonB [Glaciimonas sp.]